MSVSTTENIGYVGCIIYALLGIVIAVGFLLKNQDESNKKLKPVAIVLILVAVSAATFSTIGIYLSGHMVDKRSS